MAADGAPRSSDAPAPASRTPQALARWAVPALWVAVAVIGGEAVSDAVAGRSWAVRSVAIIGCWVGWGLAAVASVIPSALSLTVTRVLIPASIAVTVATAIAGTPVATVVILAIAAVAASAACLVAEYARMMVQASAYGDEVRVPLRAPIGFLTASVVTWMIWVSAVVAGPLLLAAANLVAGLPVTAIAVVGSVLLPRRWHQLSSRWLVFVPAGLVVHDRVVLAETLMVRRRALRSVGLALEGTDAVDLTGPAAGHLVEVTAVEPLTALLTATSRRARATPVELRSFLVSPTRPGVALAEARRRRFPVGSVAG